MKAKYIMVYDGDCGVCSALVRWVEKHDRHKLIGTEPSSSFDPQKHGMKPDKSIFLQTVVFIDTRRGKQYTRSRAIFEILKRTGGLFYLPGLLLSNPAVSFLADPLYNLMAKNRTKISRLLRLDACKIDYKSSSSTMGQ